MGQALKMLMAVPGFCCSVNFAPLNTQASVTYAVYKCFIKHIDMNMLIYLHCVPVAEGCNSFDLSSYGLCLDYGFRGATWTTLGNLRILSPGQTGSAYWNDTGRRTSCPTCQLLCGFGTAF